MNSDEQIWLRAARDLYVDTAKRTMEWVLARPRFHNAFLNTKMHSITLQDYTGEDGWRGPDILYGWIQGRGLESLLIHADFFDEHEPDLAARLRETARPLYQALATLYARDGHGYFYYDHDLKPIRPGRDDVAETQLASAKLHSFADIFFLKGLLTGAAQFDLPACDGYLAGLQEVMGSVAQGRFVSDEKQPFQDQEQVRYAPDYGPYMIMLGAAVLVARLGFRDQARFGDDIIAHILGRYVADGTGALPRGALPDQPGQDLGNPGHAIEFAGFAMEYLAADGDETLVRAVEDVLLTSFAKGFSGPGINLSVSLSRGEPLSPYYPWWALPETIRAAAVAYGRTRNPDCLGVWRDAHGAFFGHFWRGDPPLAYHCMGRDGPLDYMPATPDLVFRS